MLRAPSFLAVLALTQACTTTTTTTPQTTTTATHTPQERRDCYARELLVVVGEISGVGGEIAWQFRRSS